jgi:hypothetical protein
MFGWNRKETIIFWLGVVACAVGHIIASLLNLLKYTI